MGIRHYVFLIETSVRQSKTAIKFEPVAEIFTATQVAARELLSGAAIV